MARLDLARQQKLEPKRFKKAINKIKELGYVIKIENDNCISFEFKKNKILYYPYSGWATGKGINDSRGLKNLLKQII